MTRNESGSHVAEDSYRQISSEEHYTELDAPVRRLAATDTFVGYSPALEDFTLPQVDDIHRAILDLAAW